MKKVLVFFLSLSILIMQIPCTAFAQNIDSNKQISTNQLIKNELINLEIEKQNNLNSIKEQLEKQNLTTHYSFYEKIINDDYIRAQNSILLKYEQPNEAFLKSQSNHSYYAPNGGEISYQMYYGSYYGTIDITCLSPSDSKNLTDSYQVYKPTTIPVLLYNVISGGAAIVSPAIGITLYVYESVLVLDSFITDSTIQNIKNTRSGTAKFISTTTASGSQSTVLVAWTDYASLSVPYENSTYQNVTYTTY